MLRTFLLLGLTCLLSSSALGSRALGSSPREASLCAWQGDGSKELIAELLDKGDRVDAKQFTVLAKLGTPAAFKGLQKVVEELRTPYRVRQAYAAFVEFRDHPELGPKVITLLRKDALRHKRDSHQLGAAHGLVRLGAVAHEALEDLLRSSRSDEVRRIAVVPLVPALASRGDKASLDAIFDYAPLSGSTRITLLDSLKRGALDAERGDALIEELAKRLANRKVGAGIKAILLEALGGVQHPAAQKALLSCMDHENPEVQLRAIELVGRSGQVELASKVEVLTKSKDDAVLREAIGALGRLLKDDPDWMRRVARWTRDRRIGARMGACLALVESKDRTASKQLHGMLTDDEWRVRAEAIEQVLGLRRKPSVPILIERLGQEQGRLVQDLARALRLLTGLNHGTRKGRWSAWWKGEGEAFVLPSLEQALAAERQRAARPGKERSVAKFYGLQILSGSVAFVVDVSGSMGAKAEGTMSRTSKDADPSRLDVAKQQLAQAVKGLADGVLFNIIAFGTNVKGWKPKQLEMGRKVRDQALAHVGDIAMGGGTNTFGGLMAAFEDERVDTIYLLSDGQPSAGEITRPDEIRERFRRLNRVRKVRIHCISIGQASAFMRGLAEDTGGRYVEVL